MRKRHISLAILFSLICWSNVNAANFQSDLTFNDPTSKYKNHQQWLNEMNSQQICASEVAGYNFCLNTHNKYNLGEECHNHKMILQQCWDNYRRRIKKGCELQENQYFMFLRNRNFDTANRLLGQANECEWQKREQQKIKDYYCKQGESQFYKSFSPSLNVHLCKKILAENRECSWYKNASLSLYNATRRPDFPSIANSRPIYYTGNNNQCPKRHTSSRKVIDTNGNPNDNTKTTCAYFSDGSLKLEIPHIDHPRKKECIDGLYRSFGTALDGSHPIGRETNYKNCVKHGVETMYSWCQTKSQRNSKRTTHYPGWEIIWENGKKISEKPLPSGCQ